MSGQSLGLIETVGLTVAVEAADAAMKSANVDLIGYELTKGGGLVTVKLTGEVGAINAAVSAGVAAAGRIGSVYAWKVIARTATGIDGLIVSKETCGVAPQVPVMEENKPVTEDKEKVIPVANLEYVVTTADCLAQEEIVIADTPVSQPVVTASEQGRYDESSESYGEQTVTIAAEKTVEQNAHDDKKPLRTRTKGVRR